jgi:hypothetical protein
MAHRPSGRSVDGYRHLQALQAHREGRRHTLGYRAASFAAGVLALVVCVVLAAAMVVLVFTAIQSLPW